MDSSPPVTNSTPKDPEVQGTPKDPEEKGIPKDPEEKGTPKDPEEKGNPAPLSGEHQQWYDDLMKQTFREWVSFSSTTAQPRSPQEEPDFEEEEDGDGDYHMVESESVEPENPFRTSTLGEAEDMMSVEDVDEGAQPQGSEEEIEDIGEGAQPQGSEGDINGTEEEEIPGPPEEDGDEGMGVVTPYIVGMVNERVRYGKGPSGRGKNAHFLQKTKRSMRRAAERKAEGRPGSVPPQYKELSMQLERQERYKDLSVRLGGQMGSSASSSSEGFRSGHAKPSRWTSRWEQPQPPQYYRWDRWDGIGDSQSVSSKGGGNRERPGSKGLGPGRGQASGARPQGCEEKGGSGAQPQGCEKRIVDTLQSRGKVVLTGKRRPQPSKHSREGSRKVSSGRGQARGNAYAGTPRSRKDDFDLRPKRGNEGTRPKGCEKEPRAASSPKELTRREKEEQRRLEEWFQQMQKATLLSTKEAVAAEIRRQLKRTPIRKPGRHRREPSSSSEEESSSEDGGSSSGSSEEESESEARPRPKKKAKGKGKEKGKEKGKGKGKQGVKLETFPQSVTDVVDQEVPREQHPHESVGEFLRSADPEYWPLGEEFMSMMLAAEERNREDAVEPTLGNSELPSGGVEEEPADNGGLQPMDVDEGAQPQGSEEEKKCLSVDNTERDKDDDMESVRSSEDAQPQGCEEKEEEWSLLKAEEVQSNNHVHVVNNPFRTPTLEKAGESQPQGCGEEAKADWKPTLAASMAVKEKLQRQFKKVEEVCPAQEEVLPLQQRRPEPAYRTVSSVQPRGSPVVDKPGRGYHLLSGHEDEKERTPEQEKQYFADYPSVEQVAAEVKGKEEKEKELLRVRSESKQRKNAARQEKRPGGPRTRQELAGRSPSRPPSHSPKVRKKEGSSGE